MKSSAILRQILIMTSALITFACGQAELSDNEASLAGRASSSHLYNYVYCGNLSAREFQSVRMSALHGAPLPSSLDREMRQCRQTKFSRKDYRVHKITINQRSAKIDGGIVKKDGREVKNTWFTRDVTRSGDLTIITLKNFGHNRDRELKLTFKTSSIQRSNSRHLNGFFIEKLSNGRGQISNRGGLHARTK